MNASNQVADLLVTGEDLRKLYALFSWFVTFIKPRYIILINVSHIVARLGF